MGIDLPLIWAVIIIFGIMMYVIMDGFDLGIGMLFPFIKDDRDRDVMMNTVAPVWDGNETWLVLGGAALFGAFPLAYAVVLSALYLPLMLMLVGLIFRGVAFEFRFKAKADKRHIWDKAFIGGSLAATFFQGVALGAFIEGFKVVDRSYAGGSLDWLSPFSLFCGVGLRTHTSRPPALGPVYGVAASALSRPAFRVNFANQERVAYGMETASIGLDRRTQLRHRIRRDPRGVSHARTRIRLSDS